MSSSSSFLLLLLLVLFSSTLLHLQATNDVEWYPIKNLNDPHVTAIARFAVSEHDKQANANLTLTKVVKGESQVMEGRNYWFVIEAKGGDYFNQIGTYEAVVYENVLCENSKFVYKLESFISLTN